MLTDNQVRAILEFMKRVQLSGSEAPMFVECVNALIKLLPPLGETAI